MDFIYLAASLDGFIAKKDVDIDWLQETPNPDNDDYAEFMAGIDAVVMGCKSFEKVLIFDGWHDDKKVFVLSRALKEEPQELQDEFEVIA